MICKTTVANETGDTPLTFYGTWSSVPKEGQMVGSINYKCILKPTERIIVTLCEGDNMVYLMK